MARPSAATVFVVLLFSFLAAVAHCRTLESEPATETTTLAVADEIGTPVAVVPAEQDGFLRLPSHRRHGHHHPCRHGLFHLHLWWARHHDGLFGDGHHHRSDAGEPSKGVEVAKEVKAVAEPDPDRSVTGSDDGEDDDEPAAVKRWRMFRHGLRHHHQEDEDQREQEVEGAAGVKRFHHKDEEEDDEKEKKMRKLFHHHHDEDEEEKVRKPFHHADDSDDKDDEMEEMIRHFRKAIMRRRFFRHHYRFLRHHHHHHADEAAERQQEEGGVMTWIKGLMNRF